MAGRQHLAAKPSVSGNVILLGLPTLSSITDVRAFASGSGAYGDRWYLRKRNSVVTPSNAGHRGFRDRLGRQNGRQPKSKDKNCLCDSGQYMHPGDPRVTMFCEGRCQLLKQLWPQSLRPSGARVHYPVNFVNVTDTRYTLN